jgi:C-methyltransferase C-terminal domain
VFGDRKARVITLVRRSKKQPAARARRCITAGATARCVEHAICPRNYCGIRTDFLDYTVDRNPYKHGKFTPGTRIPIHAPERIYETRPDYLLILPWNLRDEIVRKMASVRDWGCKFVVPIPQLQVFD